MALWRRLPGPHSGRNLSRFSKPVLVSNGRAVELAHVIVCQIHVVDAERLARSDVARETHAAGKPDRQCHGGLADREHPAARGAGCEAKMVSVGDHAGRVSVLLLERC